MAKSHPTSRDRSLLVIQVETLEDRRLLSGLGGVRPIHEPFAPPAEFSAAIPFSPTLSASHEKGVTLAQRVTPREEPVAPPSAVPGQASPAAGRPAALPSETAGPDGTGPRTTTGRGATTFVPEPGAQSIGREDSPAHWSNEIGTPPGRALGMGRGYGRATANEHAAAAGGQEETGAELGLAAPGNGRIPPGLLRGEATGVVLAPSAPASETSSVAGLGRTSFDPPAPGANLGSTAARADRVSSGVYDRTSLMLSSLAVPFDVRHSDVDLLAMLRILKTSPSEEQDQDSPAPAGTASQSRAQAADLTHWSSGDRPLVPSSDDLTTASAIRATRHRGELSPEISDLEADPATHSVQALLRDLEKLRDQLQTAGEYATDWLFDREISDWILLALVVAVTVESIRREVWHREDDPSLVDGEGFRFPLMV